MFGCDPYAPHSPAELGWPGNAGRFEESKPCWDILFVKGKETMPSAMLMAW